MNALVTPTAAARPGIGSRLVELAVRRLMKIPGRSGVYGVEKGIKVPTRDGFHLITDHYVPGQERPGGTILIRGPYGRAFPNSVVYGAIYAGAGYHTLIQSVRGTFGSTDVFRPFIKEAEDGQDTVAWLRSQPWFDGRLATFGGSYLGFVQWALLENPPKELRAAVIVVGPHDFGRALHGSGAFALSMAFGWSEAMASVQSSGRMPGPAEMLMGDRRTRPGLYGLPLLDAGEQVLKGGAPWYRDWLSRPDLTDPYWDAARSEALGKSEVPTLLVGGWQDIFLEQTLDQYRTLSERHVDVALTVGPWTHLDTIGKASGLIGRESLGWLNHHMAGGNTRTKPVRIFVTGANQWREYDRWPPATHEQAYSLSDSGALAESVGKGESTFKFDPADPTPVLGGRLMNPSHAGVKDNRTLEARDDVITFTSPPFARDLDLIGAPSLDLAVSVDNPNADVFVRLCDVNTRGRSRNLTDGFIRLNASVPANEKQKVSIRFDPCAHRVASGHRLRLLVSGGAHPRFARNLGAGEPAATGQKMLPAVHVIHHHESRVVLPIADVTDGSGRR